MPRKIRELKADLRRAGCVVRSAKGSHGVWEHPSLAKGLPPSGNDGKDAQPYQEKQVRAFLDEVRRAKEQQ